MEIKLLTIKIAGSIQQTSTGKLILHINKMNEFELQDVLLERGTQPQNIFKKIVIH